MAMGVKQTHVKGSKVDMQFLADLVKKTGADDTVVEKVKKANTARHVLEIIKESENNDFFKLLCKEVYWQMRKHSENKVTIEVILFDFDGMVLERYSEQ